MWHSFYETIDGNYQSIEVVTSGFMMQPGFVARKEATKENKKVRKEIKKNGNRNKRK